MMDGFLIDPQHMVIVRWLFLRALGGIYLIAFTSFGVQARGLIGSNGISPARAYLDLIGKALGRRGFIHYPTLAWLNRGDTFLVGICAAGSILSAALVLGADLPLLLLVLWLLYLSCVTVGQEFLSFQWDVLLLETGFLAIFLAPPILVPQAVEPLPSPLVIFLYRFLAFRLMFMSGVLKIAGGDLTWRNLTALAYHYETQPLPAPPAFYFFRAPLAFQKFSTLFTLIVETIIPFGFFAPMEIRVLCAGLIVLLQLIIMLTGNYAFFNLLSIALAIPLLDDTLIRGLFSTGALRLVPEAAGVGWSNWIVIPLAVVLAAAGVLFILARLGQVDRVIKAVQPVLQYVIAFRLVNPYGLFVAMTTERPEIIVEGSEDGKNWSAYEFKYKVGNPRKPLRWIAPHQPRLDWQMWFAALGGYAENAWFLHFIERLLEGSRDVIALLEKDPFDGRPPRYIRAQRYDYHFSTPQEKAKSGAWWARRLIGSYLPVVSFEDQDKSSQ